MLAIPDGTAHRTKLADWLEFSALSAADGRVSFSTFVSAFNKSKESQAADIAEGDNSDEALMLSVQAEVRWRHKIIGTDYPFRLDENGQSMHVVADLTEAGAAYLLCLFLSHANDRTVVPKKLAPKVTNRVRDLFQACATVAAGGFVRGPAISFGWPRPKRTQFLKELKRVYTLFGDGKPVRRPRPAAAKNVKDDGIDIIAWRHQTDKLPGTQYLLGQAASGEDWVHKSVIADARHFHEYWFEERPASEHQNAMFMPFCLDPPGDGVAADDEILKDHMQNLSYRYGNLFYRYRIAEFVAHGIRLRREGQHNIDRVSDLAKVIKWVKRYRRRLLAA